MLNAAWYALRRTLPLWNFEENLAELAEQLPRYRVDELRVKVDSEEFTHGQPILSWIEDASSSSSRASRWDPRLAWMLPMVPSSLARARG